MILTIKIQSAQELLDAGLFGDDGPKEITVTGFPESIHVRDNWVEEVTAKAEYLDNLIHGDGIELDDDFQKEWYPELNTEREENDN